MVLKYDSYLEKYLKEYQENPRSRVFAPLAEAYRKSGLVDEAIEICREGLEYHPNFISGMVAIARCYFDKGLYTATIRELEKVVSEVPDNYLAQKLLAQSYILVGDNNNAVKAFKMVLYLNPKDEEAKSVVSETEKDELKGITEEPLEAMPEEPEDIPLLPFANPPAFETKEDFKVIDDIAKEASLGFEEKPLSQAFNVKKEEEATDQVLTDISTMTMGELLENQGLKDKALEVYKKIYEQNPNQPRLKEKIEAIEKDLGIKDYQEEVEEATTSPEDHQDETQIMEKAFTGELISAETKPSTPNYKPGLLDEEFDEQWILHGTQEDLRLAKLKDLLQKVKVYKSSYAR